MSKTPRTDNATFTHYDEMLDAEFKYVRVDFAEKLEREIGQLCAALEQEERRRLGAEDCLKSWKEDEGADAARLDWLDNHVGLYDVAEYFVCDLLTHDQMCNLTLREGIDAAMEAQNDEQ